MASKTIGILTSGGDCPGLNAVIRAAAVHAIRTYGWRVLGVHESTLGLIARPVQVTELTLDRLGASMMRAGGTILGTTNKGDPFDFPMLDGTRKDRVDEVIEGYQLAGLDALIVVGGDGSFSIDQQRYNGQFAGQVFYEVKGGKIVGMLKDVAYQFKTPLFWGSMKQIGGPRSYFLGGAFGDAKGQPGQSNSVSHGCPPARFEQTNIINTGRRA